MRPIVVIELDVFCDRCAELFFGFIIVPTGIIFLDGSKERFCYGIVMWRTRQGEGLGNTMLFEKAAKFK